MEGILPCFALFYFSRLVQSFPQPLETKPLLSQRESVPAGSVPPRTDRRPLSDTFTDSWNDSSHYDNTGFVAEESAVENPSANPLLSTKSRSTSAHGRRPLIRQDRIVGIPLELEQPTLRNTHESEVPLPILGKTGPEPLVLLKTGQLFLPNWKTPPPPALCLSGKIMSKSLLR